VGGQKRKFGPVMETERGGQWSRLGFLKEKGAGNKEGKAGSHDDVTKQLRGGEKVGDSQTLVYGKKGGGSAREGRTTTTD